MTEGIEADGFFDHAECTERDHVECLGCGALICTALMSNFRRAVHLRTRRCFDCRATNEQATKEHKE